MASLKNPKLEFQLDDSEMLENNYSLLKLIIINNGELVAKDISIKLLTEIEAPKNSKLKVNHEDFPMILGEIKPGERKEITFGFRPTTAGRASMTILNSCKTAEGKCLLEKKDILYVMIQPDISKPPVVIEDDLIKGFDSYRKQATAVFSKGKNITDNERGMLDVIRITCNLTKEQQRQIEDEILNKNQDNRIQPEIEIISSPTEDWGRLYGYNNQPSQFSKETLIEKYRALFIQAIQDGIISKEERESLNHKAGEFHITDSEKKTDRRRNFEEIFRS